MGTGCVSGPTHWKKQLFNGIVVTVEDFKVQGGEAGTEPSVLISARTEDGRHVSFHHDEIRDWYGNIRLDHGYALKAWYAIAAKADWSSPADVKAVYGNASIVGNDGVVFNIGGNRYRLIVRFDYVHRIGFVRFVGTHAEYDAIDASDV